MRLRTTVVLIALAAISLTAALLLRATPNSPGSAPESAGLLLQPAQLPGDRIDRITLDRVGEAQLVFQRRPGGWMQVQPFPHPLVAFSIEQIIDQALGLRVVRPLAADQPPDSREMASLSLDPPRATVEFSWMAEDGASRSTKLELGRATIGGQGYLRLAGEPLIRLVNHDLHERVVETDPKEWRERRLFDLNGLEPARLAWSLGTQRLSIERSGKRWTMIEPARTRVDAARLTTLIESLERSVLSGFLVDEPADLARFGLEPPAASLAITGRVVGGDSAGSSATQTLYVGQMIGVNSQDRFGLIEGRPVVVRVPAAALASLFPTKESLAEPTACAVVPADVKLITIVAGDRRLELERDLERWIAASEDGREVPVMLVQDLLNHLTTLRATRTVFEPFPRERQVGHITLRGFARQPLDTVRIARDPATGDWAMDNGDDVLRLYPSSLELRLSPEQYGLQPSTR